MLQSYFKSFCLVKFYFFLIELNWTLLVYVFVFIKPISGSSPFFSHLVTLEGVTGAIMMEVGE